MALIKAMAIANTTWGAERIRGELLKLGIKVSKRTIQKYIDQVRPPRGTGQTWHTFIKNHADELVSIPPKSPNLNAICERFLGSVRRECLDHVLILGQRHLHRVLTEYVEAYFNGAIPHQGIEPQMPAEVGRPTGSPECGGKVVAIPNLGGLHHDYRRAA